MGGKKFAVLLCAEDSDYFGVFVKMLEEDETWHVFKVANGEFPEDTDQIGGYDGFVITGSCNDAHGNDLWICKLLNLINKLHALEKKLLGICFGHQILGRALGGTIDRATAGWDIGVTTVTLKPSKVFTTLNIPTSLQIIECHQDEILELPPKAEVMAWSNKTGIEMFKYGDHIMGIQGHPEYTKDILIQLIDRLLQRNLIEENLADVAKAKVEEQEPDREAWKKLCINFLKA